MQIKSTILQCLNQARERPADWPALRFKRHQAWLSLTWQDYFRTCESAAKALQLLGVEPGDRVALLSQTRLEWAALDYAIMGLGAVTVPVYQSSKPDELAFILNHCEPKVLIVDDREQLRKWQTVQKRCPTVKNVICLQDDWDDFINAGIDRFAEDSSFFSLSLNKVQPTDLATIVYTSGTTGEPKGVMLTHEQIMSEVRDLALAFPISNMDSTLSFLPYAHVMGRVELWLHVYSGFTLTFAESLDRLRQNLRETKPTVIIGVPRIFEKIHDGLMAQIEGNFLKKRLFTLLQGDDPIRKTLSDRLIFKKLRDGLGGKLRFVVSGGAALDPKIAEFFATAGILILEGYGLTETTAAVCVNLPDAYKFGTVGRPVGDVDVKLADDGEILIKSQKVMVGYFRDSEATEDVFRDGYFCTGDIGSFTDDGFLKITDRKKDLIKTSGGKYVAPQKLEALLRRTPLISHALIHGDKRKYIVALITININYLETLARQSGWTFKNHRDLLSLSELKELVHKEVARANADLASYETIKNFAILADDFTVERGELTPSLKIKRRVCDEKYRTVIDQLYN